MHHIAPSESKSGTFKLLLIIEVFRVTQEQAQYTNFREKEKEILDRVMDPKRWVIDRKRFDQNIMYYTSKSFYHNMYNT